MSEWIRFFLTAGFLAAGLICFTMAVIGVNRFGFAMNRIHAAGIGDTLGLLCVIVGLCISSSAVMDMLKLGLLVVFMWFSSPVSGHFLGQVEYYTNPRLYEYVERLQWEAAIDADGKTGDIDQWK